MARSNVDKGGKRKSAASKSTVMCSITKPLGNKVDSAATNVGTTSKPQYRSTLNPMHEAFDLVRGYIKPAHKKLFLQTPFSHLFDAFQNGEVNNTYKRNAPLDALLKTYSPTEKGFKIGENYYFPTRQDVQLIFGIVDGWKHVRDLSNYSLKETSLKNRLFHDEGRPNFTSVKALLGVCAQKEDPESCHDTVSLLCLLLFAGVFFATLGQNIAWAYFWFVDDFRRLSSYDWSSYILKELQHGLDKECSTPGPFNPRNVNGSTVLVWYWLCERAIFLMPICRIPETVNDVGLNTKLSKTEIPRIKKWNLKKVYGVITEARLRNISVLEFRKEELAPTVNEIFHIPSLRKINSLCDAGVDSSGEDSDVDDDSADDALELPAELLIDDTVSVEVCSARDSSVAPSAPCLCTAHVVDGAVSEKVPIARGDLGNGSADVSYEEAVLERLDPAPVVVSEQGLVSALQTDAGNCNVADASSGSDDSVGSYILKARSPCVQHPGDNIMDVIPDLPLCELLTPSPPRPSVDNVAQLSKSFDVGTKPVGASVLRTLEERRKNNGGLPSFDLFLTPPVASPQDQTNVVDRLTTENLTLSTNLEHANSKLRELQTSLAKKISSQSRLVLVTKKANDFQSENVRLSALVTKLNTTVGVLQSKILMLQQDAKDSHDQLLSKHTETEELKLELKKLNAELLHSKRTIVDQHERIGLLLKERCVSLTSVHDLNKQLERAQGMIYEKDNKLGELHLLLLEKVATIDVLKESATSQRNKISKLEQKINDLETSLSLLAPECFVDAIDNGSSPSDIVVQASNLSSSPPKKSTSVELQIIPYSIERGVKHNPRKREKINQDLYDFPEQKKKTKISQEHPEEHKKWEEVKQQEDARNPYFIPVENPLVGSNKLFMHEDRFLYPCGEYILPHVYNRLRMLNEHQGKLAEVWRSCVDFSSFVNMDSIMFILNDLYIDALVLDGVVEILKLDGFVKKSNYVFTSLLSNTLIEAVRSGLFTHQVFVDLFAALRGGKKVMFPYCCSGRESRPYHWVVLSYQLGDTHWKLFHSAPIQRGRDDIFVQECELVLEHVLEGIRSNCDRFVREKSSIFTKVVKAPRIPLHDTANNSCLYVAYFLHKLAQDIAIPRALEDSDVQKWKATVVNALCLNTFQSDH